METIVNNYHFEHCALLSSLPIKASETKHRSKCFQFLFLLCKETILYVDSIAMFVSASQLDNGWQSMKSSVLERNSHMFNNPFMSDVTLTSGENKLVSFYAHKYVVATSSPVFYAMFYGSMAENVATVHLCDTDDTSLREFLRFLYTDEVTLTLDVALPMLYLAKKYLVYSLIEKCKNAIRANITPANVVALLENRVLFDRDDVEIKSWESLDRFTSTAMKSDHFYEISHSTLMAIVKRNTLNISEIELFQALLEWITYQCLKRSIEASSENKRRMIGNVIYEVRMLSMTEEEFLNCVASSGLLSKEEIFLVVDKLKGINITKNEPEFKWILGKRQIYSTQLKYVTRFSSGDIKPPSTAWTYGNTSKPDKLSFSFDRSVNLHGVRMFGDANNSTYSIDLDIHGTTVSGSYTSELMDHGIYGYDVIFPTPVVIEPNTFVTITATIAGPNSYYGNNVMLPTLFQVVNNIE